MIEKMSELHTTAQIAKMMGRTRQTVLNWIYKGKLPAIQVGKNYLIAYSDFLNNVPAYMRKEALNVKKEKQNGESSKDNS